MSDLPDTWRPALPSQAIREDYHYLREVVRVGFPVREALVFLARHLGNPISYRLVEVLRGEKPGIIRAVEVQAATGGEPRPPAASRPTSAPCGCCRTAASPPTSPLRISSASRLRW